MKKIGKYTPILFILFFTIINMPMHASDQTIPLQVLFGNPEKSTPTISPDGAQLAYLAPLNNVMNIWVKTIGQDDDRVITNQTHRGITVFCWAHNNNQILYKQDHNGDENFHIFSVDLTTNTIVDLTPFEKTKADVLLQSKKRPDEILVQLNKNNPKLFDVYKLNTVTGAIELIEDNPGTVTCWLADSKFNVRAAVTNNPDAGQTLLLKDNDNKWQPFLTFDFEDTIKDELYNGLLSFSKDGDSLYLISSYGNNTRALIEVDLATKTQKTLAIDDIYNCTSTTFEKSTSKPEIVSFQKARLTSHALLQEAEKDLEYILSLSNGDLQYIQKNADGSKWVIGFLYDNKSQDYYLYDKIAQQAEFLFCSRPQLDTYQLAHTQPISLTSRDGLTLHGYLTCPVGIEHKNLPLVLCVHGGPFSRDTWGFKPEVQWLASRGYACLQINFRGSVGYGKSFLAAGNGEWGGKMHDDLIDAVQWAIDTGIADPARIAIYGGSYGGYAALVGGNLYARHFLLRC
jgi:dipeptidyl aminopeptidase/acylaminoacyl peptidase